MGCYFSKLLSFFSSSTPSTKGDTNDVTLNESTLTTNNDEQPKVYSWDNRATINLQDYTLENKKGETIVKLPDSINGQQYIIQNLEDCFVYIFDHTAIVTVDECKNCRFFIGPCKGSVFIRNCNDCNFALICQQFRTRDCKRITTFISCVTQPIIEASTSMRFACLSVNYKDLEYQLKCTRISIFNSNWNSIHDFTRIPGQQNYTLLSLEQKLEDYIPLPEDSIRSQMELSYEIKDSFIPFTVGTMNRKSNESCLIVLFTNSEQPKLIEKQAKSLLKSTENTHNDLALVNSKFFSLNEMSAENVFGSKLYAKYLQKGPVIGLEFNGNDCIRKLQELVPQLKIENVYISDSAAIVQKQLDNFYNYAEMQMSA